MGCLAADDAFWRPEERSWTLPDRLEGFNSEAGSTGNGSPKYLVSYVSSPVREPWFLGGGVEYEGGDYAKK